MSNKKYQLPPIGSLQSSKKSNKLFPVLIVLFVTAVLAFVMIMLKPKEQKKENSKIIPAVEVIQVSPIDYIVPIQSDGMVVPKTKINISAEVSGKITYVSGSFNAGGKFNKGDILVKVDPVDYELAVTRAQANVSAQQANLDLQQAKSDLAKSDWKKYGKKGKPSPLNLNLPQVASAKAALSGARADLKLAKRNLDKTMVVAPFSGVVLSKMVDLGQFISLSTPLASVASTQIAEIRMSLSDEQLHNSGLDKFDGSQNMTVEISSEETPGVLWQGTIARIEAQRDAKTLFNYAIIEIAQPFTQQNTALRFNTFVNVKLGGETLEQVYPVERGYVMLDGKVNLFIKKSLLEDITKHLTANDSEEYLISKLKKFNIFYSIVKIDTLKFYKWQYPILFMPQSQLGRQKVHIAYSDEKKVYVDKGLDKDDWIITTSISSTTKVGSELKKYSKYDEDS
jgi:RND family efflux transporter MFP subunit